MKFGIDTAYVKKKLRQLERELTITPHPLHQQTKARTGVDVAKVEAEATAKANKRETDKLEQHLMERPSGYLL